MKHEGSESSAQKAKHSTDNRLHHTSAATFLARNRNGPRPHPALDPGDGCLHLLEYVVSFRLRFHSSLLRLAEALLEVLHALEQPLHPRVEVLCGCPNPDVDAATDGRPKYMLTLHAAIQVRHELAHQLLKLIFALRHNLDNTP